VGDGSVALRRALCDHALELLRFMPPSWSVEPSFYTVEGHGSARWRVRDRAAARERRRVLGGLGSEDSLEIDITVRHDAPGERLCCRSERWSSSRLLDAILRERDDGCSGSRGAC
jgi:hypothetical protein